MVKPHVSDGGLGLAALAKSADDASTSSESPGVGTQVDRLTGDGKRCTGEFSRSACARSALAIGAGGQVEWAWLSDSLNDLHEDVRGANALRRAHVEVRDSAKRPQVQSEEQNTAFARTSYDGRRIG